jgi:hypothetical protein
VKPVVPAKGHPGSEFFEIGLGQHDYAVLPGYRDRDGLVMTEWAMTDEERAALAAGAPLRLWVKTHGLPLQPVFMEISA